MNSAESPEATGSAARGARPALAWPSWLCALGPAALAVGLITLMVHVRLGVGHWPEPMREDYRTFAYHAHSLAVLWLFAHSLFLAPVAGGLLLCFRATRGSWRLHLRQLAWFAAGWCLTLAVWHGDPFRFVTWLKD